MNTLLTIQVKVAAREAQAALRQLISTINSVNSASAKAGNKTAGGAVAQQARLGAAELKKLNQNLMELKGQGTFTSLGRQAEAFAKKVENINRNIKRGLGTGPGWQQPAGMGASVNVKAGQAAAEAAQVRAAEQAKQQAVRTTAQINRQTWNEQIRASRAAQASEREDAKRTETYMKQIWAEQVRDFRAGKKQEQEAARQAAAVEREVQAQNRAALKQTNTINKQTWNEQVRAARTAAAQEREEAKRTETYMKQIWNEQVRNFKTAKKEEQAAAKEAAQAERAAAAQAAKNPAAGLNALGRLSLKVNGETNNVRRGMIAMGKDMQWVGRQINFNFTIPLLLAGRGAMDWALKSEAAFTRLKKVYGQSGKDYRQELDKIKHALRLLSDMYGVNAEAVNELAAQWAAAGATGAELAQSVKTSLDLSILGDYTDLGDVFTQLITIQGAYQMSTDQLAGAIRILNTVENMTAATLPDLVVGIARAGAAGRAAGVDIRHLSAMIATLVPATGGAAQAGNAVKTILARIMAPTQDTIDVLKAMGIQFYDTTFQAKNGAERIEFLAEKFKGLTDAQKANAASVIGSRYQYNKLLVLLQDIGSSSSKYKEVLAAIKPELDTKNFQQANKEIQTLLNSDPRKLEILTNMIKNDLIDAVTPLIPALLGVLNFVQALFTWFGKLDPKIQAAAFAFLGLVVAIGILAQVIGSVQLLFGTFLKFALFLINLIPGVSVGAVTAQAAIAESTATLTAAMAEQTAAVTAAISATVANTTGEVAAGAEAQVAIVEGMAGAEVGILSGAATAIVAFLTSPWTLAAIAIAAAIAGITFLIFHFSKQIGNAFAGLINWLTDAWYAFPNVIANGLLAILRFVQDIIKKIMHWLSYLNPFARHSPSLVDNVTAGVEAILKQYGRLANIGSIFSKAAADLKAFAAATEAANEASKKLERADTKKNIVAQSPGAGPAVDALFGDLDVLNAKLAPLTQAIAAQEAVVRPLELAYNLAANAVDQFEASMEPLVTLVESLSKQIDDANAKIQEFASTNIIGMKAASDAAFENEMAQKRLRLELLKMGDAGEGFDEIQKKIAKINGDIENLRGTMTDLRQAGAGSDVLSVYNDQLSALEAQKNSLTQSAQNGQNLTDQLAALQHQADIMDLETSLKFDPLLRQIDDLANATKELSFADIMKGIRGQKDIVAKLTVEYDKNKKALDTQQRTLDKLIATRDRIKAQYDVERTKLEGLKIQYQAVADQISDIEDALKTASSQADALAKAAKGAADNFGDLTGQFEDVPLPTFEDGKSLDDLIAEWEKKSKEMFKFDPFAGLKKWAEPIGEWIGMHVVLPVINKGLEIVAWFQKLPDKIGTFFATTAGKIKGYFIGAITWLYNRGSDILTGLKNGITAAAVAVWNWFAGIKEKILGYFLSPLLWLLSTGKDIITGLFRGLKNIGADVWGWFSGIKTKVLGYFGNAVSWLVEAGKDLVRGLINGVTKMLPSLVSTLVDALPGPSDLVYGPLGWVLKKALPGKEQGGIITKEQIVRVGEHNRAEAIIPLTNPLRALQIMQAAGLMGILAGTAVNTNDHFPVLRGGNPAVSGPTVNAKTIIISGDISLPNITSPEDAEKFLANIEALAGV